MDDLARWLHVQLDTDERVAREAPTAIGSTGHSDGAWADPQARWVADHHLVMRRPLTGDEEVRIVADCATLGGPPAAVHIAVHDPARVLREVDAKRRLLAEYERVIRKRDVLPAASLAYEHWDDRAYGLALALRYAAAVYVDRPGYQEAWRP